MGNRNQRWWDFQAALLLIIALGVTVLRLRVTRWSPDLGVVETVNLLGVLLGLMLGYSSFSRRAVRWYALAMTPYVVVGQLGTLVDFRFTWLERLWVLGDRLRQSLTLFFLNQPVKDSILFVTLMALLFWVLSLTAGYHLTRSGKPWVALIISAVAMGLIELYSASLTGSRWYSGIFVLVCLLLAARLFYLGQSRRWTMQEMIVEDGVAHDLSRGALLCSLLLVLAAWTLPSLFSTFSPGSDAQRSVSRSWERVRDRMSNAFAGLQGEAVKTVEVFTNQIYLDAGAELDDTPVFSVLAAGERPQGSRYYWRARSYDEYLDSGWRATVRQKQLITADETDLLNYPDWRGRRQVSFTFKLLQPVVSNLYAPAVPLLITRPFQAVYEPIGDGRIDLTAQELPELLNSGSAYTVQAWVSAPTVLELRAAGKDYPDWVRERYLQLPKNLPERIPRLAAFVTQGLNVPYDQAVAITRYLRTTMKYERVVAMPPLGQDPLEWFLFETRTGFCNYYATAEVVLLRSLGIPARLAAGYAQGEFDEPTSSYLVRKSDSHAWPEVYFPNVGWVEFEPTTSQPDRELPSGEELAGLSEEEQQRLEDKQGNRRRAEMDELRELPEGAVTASTPVSVWRSSQIALLVLLPLMVVLTWLGYRWRMCHVDVPLAVLLEAELQKRGILLPKPIHQWVQRSRYTPVEKMFAHVAWFLKLLGQSAQPGQTPAEQVNQLVKVLPAIAQPAAVLLEEYQCAVYSQHPANLQRMKLSFLLLRREVYRAVWRRWTGAEIH